MPDSSDRGRHRRPRPVSRVSVTVTAGGAGLALPLMTASGAPAAANPAEAHHGVPLPRTGDAATPLPQGARTAVIHLRPQTAPDRRVTHYTVRPGDTLSAIAAAHHVRGGWPALYERNRRVIGSDPNLIRPGQRLLLHGPRTSAPPAKSESGQKPKPRADSKSGPKPKPRAGSESGTRTQTGHGYVAPLANAHVGTGYGVRGSAWSSGYHTGADFPVPVGTGVRAVSGGTVVTAGWGGAYGYQVVVRHADGRYSQYAHLSALTVRAGQHVNPGQRIARSGSTGNTTGPHLHFEIRTGPGYGSDIDPIRYLRSKGVTI
ncbi:peptidoglycan DD-metalloendopeptidase family protein [Streptomyces sp. NPDC051940]|uniref:M23 family metallopeptidase n=1 Tax=Streptomyces sp. NPDC051940 TaxID=3155675 RepID=UPI00342D586C